MTVLGYITPNQDYTEDLCLRMVVDLAEILKRDRGKSQDIHSLFQQLLKAAGKAEETLGKRQLLVAWQIIFRILGWMTGTVQLEYTMIEYYEDTFPMPLPMCCFGTQRHHTVDAARRPLHDFLEFGQLLPERMHAAAYQDSLIYVLNLSYNALGTFGKITIDWCDTLSSHFCFHPSSRFLYVFRYPSICEMYLNGDPNNSVFYKYAFPLHNDY